MAWHNGKKVTALWVNDERSNSWGYIDGAWRKYENAQDTACTNFTIVCAHAKADNRNVNARIENDRLKEIYVW
jgi:hypothetical protein